MQICRQHVQWTGICLAFIEELKRELECFDIALGDYMEADCVT